MVLQGMCIIAAVMHMKNRELLSSLLKTTQTGQVELRSALDTVMGPGLRAALQSQLREYDALETEALSIALQRGWELKELDIGQRFLADRKTRFLVTARKTDSGIAEVMIRKNTDALIGGLRNIHRFQDRDPQVRILSQKILDCETAHIRSLQKYL